MFSKTIIYLTLKAHPGLVVCVCVGGGGMGQPLPLHTVTIFISSVLFLSFRILEVTMTGKIVRGMTFLSSNICLLNRIGSGPTYVP